MADARTLLSFVVGNHTLGLEDAATDALSFILSRSDSAKGALANFLENEGRSLPIEKAETWMADSHGAIPDMALLDGSGQVVGLIECKFWASLTHHQPVTYWERLPVDRPAVLLFLAPESRVNESSLWDELVDRLGEAGHELDTAIRKESFISAYAIAGQRRLMLTSWQLLLSSMAQKTKDDGEDEAAFEIAQLQGLAEDAIVGGNPRRDDNLKKLIADAVRRVEGSGWANTDGLTVGRGFGFYARYLRLAGVNAGLGIDYDIFKRRPDRPLWLTFYRYTEDTVGLDEARAILEGLDEPGMKWRDEDVSVPIVLPENSDAEATLDAVVDELERIARLIDPNGPSYRTAD